MYEPLRLPRIEAKSKRVRKSKRFVDFVGAAKDPDLGQELYELAQAIKSGKRVPERFYRNRIESSPDGLLEHDGIMHLHLGGRSSDILLFLVQYEADVVFLQISNHRDLETDPPGKNVMAVHGTAIGELQRQMAEDKAQEIEALRARVRASLKPKKRRAGMQQITVQATTTKSRFDRPLAPEEPRSNLDFRLSYKML